MAVFSATDAALEGFRIARERPRALLACSVFTFVVGLLGIFIEVHMPDEARAAIAALQGQEQLKLGAFVEALTILSPLLIFSILVQCVMAAAIYRVLLWGEIGSIRLFRLGATELRLMALSIIYMVAAVVLLAGATLFAVLVGFVVSPVGTGAVVFVGTVAWIFAIGLILFVSVRMSLAPVITFERSKLALFDSWPITRGQFWRLLGAYLLAISSVAVVLILASMIFLAIAGVVKLVSGGSLADIRDIFQPSASTFGAYFEPLRLAYMVVSSVGNALWCAVVAAPGAFAYRALTGARE